MKTDVSLPGESAERLAFVHWQYAANEKAYENGLITKDIYCFAKDELRKSINRLAINAGCEEDGINGFTQGSASVG